MFHFERSELFIPALKLKFWLYIVIPEPPCSNNCHEDTFDRVSRPSEKEFYFFKHVLLWSYSCTLATFQASAFLSQVVLRLTWMAMSMVGKLSYCSLTSTAGMVDSKYLLGTLQRYSHAIFQSEAQKNTLLEIYRKFPIEIVVTICANLRSF